ncbi:unnamed protein product [Cylindrotheca closterium]|uniref:Uncharacterized protein n=1 Tax=Cylindrotheca closterium TaxID=2856 RepID=A0AAD2FN23_9STRA|nr:unnamed protein product [Cylindrotheca closterium]
MDYNTMCYSSKAELYKRRESLSSRSSTQSSDCDDDFFALVDDITMTQEAPKTKSLKKVRFGALSVVEFGIRIGDSIPCFGPPIGLGLEVIKDELWSVNHYEAVRPKRRSPKELRLDPWERTRLLYRQGYDPETIQEAAFDADSVRAHRKDSAMDQDKPIQERPGLLRKGSKKIRRLSSRMKLPRVSRVMPLLLTTARRH